MKVLTTNDSNNENRLIWIEQLKMIELASLRFANINLSTSRKIDLEDEPLMWKLMKKL